jgi:hypothetical protein
MPECRTRYLCTYHANLERVQHDTGNGHFGRRMIAVVTGGAFEGERIRGKVLTGGGDWATIEDDRDVLRLDARVTWETDDGAKIYVSYRGVLRPLSVGHEIGARGGTKTDADREALYFRTSPIFETGDSRYRWLTDIVAVGVGSLIPGAVKYDVFEVL